VIYLAGGRTDTASRNGDSQKKRLKDALPEIRKSLGAAGEVVSEGLVALRDEMQGELDGIAVDCRGAKEAAAEAEINAKNAAAKAEAMERSGSELAASAEAAKNDAASAVSEARSATSALGEVKSLLSGFRFRFKANNEETETSGVEAFGRMAEIVSNLPATMKTVLEKVLSRTVEVADAEGNLTQKTLGPQELIAYLLDTVRKSGEDVKSARSSAASAMREAKKASADAEHANALVEEAKDIVAQTSEKSASLEELIGRAEEAVKKAQAVSSEIDGKISSLKQELGERLDAFEKKVDQTFGVVLQTFEDNGIDISVPEEGENNE
jgi:chromosome segregation ATPase